MNKVQKKFHDQKFFSKKWGSVFFAFYIMLIQIKTLINTIFLERWYQDLGFFQARLPNSTALTTQKRVAFYMYILNIARM